MTLPETAPSNAAHVSIAERAGAAFPSHATVHGFLHHTKGHVDLTDIAERGATARVRGKRTEDVRLCIDGGRLLIACTCPARSLGIVGCKHVWAVLLEVDRRGAWAGLRTSRRPLLVDNLEPSSGTKASPPSAKKPPATAHTPTPPPPPRPKRRANGAAETKDAAAPARRANRQPRARART